MKRLKQIVNFILAINLLIATTGFTLHKHYCMGRVKAVAINETANPCANEGTTDPMPCCEDVSEELKVEEITQVAFDFDSQPDLYELAIISWIAFDVPSFQLRQEKPQFQFYSPPPPDYNVQLEHQVFLI
ncbi:MAG: hypothetical protein AAF391_03875 [Bacteroidota bacterium]